MNLKNFTLTIVILLLFITLIMVFRTSENLLSKKTIFLALIILFAIYFIYNVFSMRSDVVATFNNAKDTVKTQSNNIKDALTNNYTYSIWFYIDDWNYKYGENKVILAHKNDNDKSNPIISLGPTNNNLFIITKYYGTEGESISQNNSCNISNIPLQKWVNVILSLNNRTLDVYLDGKLVRTCLTPGVPEINTNSKIILSPDGGFSGFTSNILHMTKSINPQQAYNIYRQGYGGSILGNLLSNYKLKLALYENNVEKSSIMI